jgi:hypothetical protein
MDGKLSIPAGCVKKVDYALKLIMRKTEAAIVQVQWQLHGAVPSTEPWRTAEER